MSLNNKNRHHPPAVFQTNPLNIQQPPFQKFCCLVREIWIPQNPFKKSNRIIEGQLGDFLFLQEVFVSSLFLLLILLVICHHIDSHLSKLCFFLRKKLIVLMRRNISPSPGVFQPSFLFCGLFLVFLLKRKRNELS